MIIKVGPEGLNCLLSKKKKKKKKKEKKKKRGKCRVVLWLKIGWEGG